ncbi:MAG: c-type cytochrome biogenesis protein CcmI [Methyloligellaceae bacterium]
MILWLIFAALTAVAIIGVFWPFLRPLHASGNWREFDTQVYKDQLAEVDADLDRGLIDATQAEAARIEISRRLLANEDVIKSAKDNKGAKVAGARSFLAQPAVIVAGLFIPAASLALYLSYGAPGLPGQPFVARMQAPPNTQSIDVLVTRAEKRLREQPDDVRGWQVIAPVYMRLNRYADAAKAYRRIIAMSGETTKTLMGLGEALVFGNDGQVTAAAHEVFLKVRELDANNNQAVFWLALSKEQNGDHEEALRDWRALLARADESSPWRKVVEGRVNTVLAKLGREPEFKTTRSTGAQPQQERQNRTAEAQSQNRSGEAGASGSHNAGQKQPAMRGPSSEDVQAAREMTPQARQAMINSMVSSLAERLNSDGGSVQEWLRLLRAYKVLGKTKEATDAYEAARKAFSDDENALKTLEQTARQLGIKTG